jgi:hypothetical protein
MPRNALAISLLMTYAACSTSLGINDVTRGDGGEGELDRLSALEDKVAMLQASLKPIAFRVSLGVPQSIPDTTTTTNTGTPVQFDTVQLDTHAAFDHQAFMYVAPEPGQYIATAIIGYKQLTKGRANCEIWVDRSGSSKSETAVTSAGNSTSDGLVRVTSTAILQLDAGDRVYVKAFHDNGAPVELLDEARSTNLQIIRIPTVK